MIWAYSRDSNILVDGGVCPNFMLFPRYMAFVKDKVHPKEAYVDTTCFTERCPNSRRKNRRILCKASGLQTEADVNLGTMYSIKINNIDEYF